MISKAQPLRSAGTVDVLPTPPDERRNPMSPLSSPPLKRPGTPRRPSELRHSEVMAQVHEATHSKHRRNKSHDTVSSWSEDSKSGTPLWLRKVRNWLASLLKHRPEAQPPAAK